MQNKTLLLGVMENTKTFPTTSTEPIATAKNLASLTGTENGWGLHMQRTQISGGTILREDYREEIPDCISNPIHEREKE